MEVNKEINDVFAPMKMLIGVMNDEVLNAFLDLMQIFIDEIQILQATSVSYSGSDFCAGVLYGIHGSRMVI